MISEGVVNAARVVDVRNSNASSLSRSFVRSADTEQKLYACIYAWYPLWRENVPLLVATKRTNFVESTHSAVDRIA